MSAVTILHIHGASIFVAIGLISDILSLKLGILDFKNKIKYALKFESFDLNPTTIDVLNIGNLNPLF